MTRMDFTRRSMRWQAALLSLLSILWLLFGSAHLHFGGHEDKPHVHSLLSAHHADFHPQHEEADIDLTPDAAPTTASKQFLDIALILTAVIFLLPVMAKAALDLPATRAPARATLFYTSPPLRAPPAHS